MDANLSNLFPSFRRLSKNPIESNDHEYIFYNENTNCWISISKTDVSTRDYALLSTLFTEIKTGTSNKNSFSVSWMQFLYEEGPSPHVEDTDIRIIQLHIKTDKYKKEDLEVATSAFFDNAMKLIFTSPSHALLIEQRSSYIHSLEDFSSFIGALESDFFIKISMYVGKFHSTASQFSKHYIIEKEWFCKGILQNHNTKIYTMENIFPTIMINELSNDLNYIIHKEILEPINFDMDLLQAVKSFFENGFNASVTAKVLHIHRNTLQYRLNKFQEITGISIRNFDGALVAYCASLIATAR